MNISKSIAVSETGFIFNPLTGDSYNVNKTAAFIIAKLREGAEASEIIPALMEEYDVDNFTAEKDLNDFLTVLKNYQLIEND